MESNTICHSALSPKTQTVGRRPSTGPSQELFSALPKALEKFDQHASFFRAQGFPNVFHDRRVLPKCFLDKLPPRCSEADYTVSPIGRMRVTPD